MIIQIKTNNVPANKMEVSCKSDHDLLHSAEPGIYCDVHEARNLALVIVSPTGGLNPAATRIVLEKLDRNVGDGKFSLLVDKGYKHWVCLEGLTPRSTVKVVNVFDRWIVPEVEISIRPSPGKNV